VGVKFVSIKVTVPATLLSPELHIFLKTVFRIVTPYSITVRKISYLIYLGVGDL